MEISDFLPRQTKKRIVDCHPDDFAKLAGTFSYLDSHNGRIDFDILESLYLKLLETVETPSRIRVLDDGATILVDRKRVEGLTTFQTSVLAFLATHGRCTIDRLLDAVWKKPDGSKDLVWQVVFRINGKLESGGYPFEIEKVADSYQIKFFSTI